MIFMVSDLSDKVSAIIELYDLDEQIVRCPLLECELLDPVELTSQIQPRLLRAATNQACGEISALSRYRIWAETLRGHLIFTLEEMGEGIAPIERARLTRVINSLGAYCKICHLIDTSNLNKVNYVKLNVREV